jgi:protein O-mannosyl-transferase
MSKTAAQLERVSAEQGASPSGGTKLDTIMGLLLAMGTLALYNPASHFDFINYDDDHYVFENWHVLAGLHWKTVVWAFSSTQEANWHPLTWLSHAVDCQLFGLNPAGHHYVNVILHTVNAVLLFLFLKRATGSLGRSFGVAALFAVHPLNVESVAWISERKNVLCTLFFLLALLAYVAYVHKRSLGRYLWVVFWFACGLMAKPMVITFPLLLLLLDYWPLRRIRGAPEPELRVGKESSHLRPASLVLEKVPLLAMSAASAVITLIAQSAGGAVRSFAQMPFSARLSNAVVSYGIYVEKTFWPSRLAPLYPYPSGGIPAREVMGATIFLLMVSVAALYFSGRFRYLVVGWLWFLGTLVPVIGLVQVGNQARADRYAYIPLIGLFVMVVWGVADLCEKKKVPRLWQSVAIASVLIGLVVVTHRQLGYWRDSVTLWSHAVRVTSSNYIAQDNLGQALTMEGDADQAIAHFRLAAQIEPRDPVSQLNIGNYEQQHGELNESVEQYHRLLQSVQNEDLRAQALTNLGSSYRLLKNYSKARESYESAIQLKPDTVLAIIGLGLVAQKAGDLEDAIQYYSRAVAIQPDDVDYLFLAQALQANGESNEAASAMKSAQQVSRDFEASQRTVEHLLAQ